MLKLITIAVDAMGGDDSPKKIIDGIVHHFNKNKNCFYKIFGNKDEISKFIPKNFSNDFYESYNECFPLEKGWEERINIYNLYPLLVHVNLFGGRYLSQVQSILSQYL